MCTCGVGITEVLFVCAAECHVAAVLMPWQAAGRAHRRLLLYCAHWRV
jgi:hypothetical protein